MISYIIQVLLFQVLFVLVYDLFLSKETFFSKNRWYLLGTASISFVLPLIKFPSVKESVPLEYTIMLPEVVLSPQQVIEKTSWYQSINYLDVLFVFGSLVFFVVFLSKVLKVITLIKENEVMVKKGYKLILLEKSTNAFSFFNYIFIGKGIPEEKREKVIKHELVHCSQNHTIDLLFFELLRIIMWFNPMVYVYQHRVSLVHEYISDAEVSKEIEKISYINNLLSDVFQVENISFINQFYKHSLIKKRIIMMTKNQSRKIRQLKYLLLIPVLGSMLFYASCSENQLEKVENKQLQKVYIGTKGRYQETKKETHLDLFISLDGESLGKEVSQEELNNEEKEELLEFKNNFLDGIKSKDDNKSPFYYKLYDFEGRKVIGLHREAFKLKATNSVFRNVDHVPFSQVDKIPTFPGCDEGDKSCFNKSMTDFAMKYFDMSMVNKLGLLPGKKRIYCFFKIDKTGKVVDLQARAPHPALKLAAIEMLGKLPKMVPGEERGEVVRVGYTLPITLNIEG
ncbi:M56 family metallopeptidase [Tenacibaculum xiamenense]|uniref:M56 family metallopeptidase n=1 Tax=Tenacibaculum xiamenense TaxID=1261553 RepID=UPI003895E143